MREKNVRQLLGREFEIVREGLDEAQVKAFITELVSERETLAQRQEHLLSLTKLAEKTVAEADRMAEEINEEATAKATQIMAKAEQEAQKVMEQKRAESRQIAERDAQAIRASARQEAELRMNEYQQRVQGTIKEGVDKLHAQLLSGLKEVAEQALALQGKWEKRLSLPIIAGLSPDDGQVSPVSPPVPMALEEIEEISPAAIGEDSEYRCDVLEQLQQVWVDADADALVPEKPALAAPSKPARQPIIEIIDEVDIAASEREPSRTYEGKVELEILPPLAPSQLVEIQSYLRDWPGIGIAELRPKNKGYSITLILDKPIQLIDILRQLPEVKDATECTSKAGVLVGDTPGKDNLRRISVTVSGRNNRT